MEKPETIELAEWGTTKPKKESGGAGGDATTATVLMSRSSSKHAARKKVARSMISQYACTWKAVPPVLDLIEDRYALRVCCLPACTWLLLLRPSLS